MLYNTVQENLVLLMQHFRRFICGMTGILCYREKHYRHHDEILSYWLIGAESLSEPANGWPTNNPGGFGQFNYLISWEI